MRARRSATRRLIGSGRGFPSHDARCGASLGRTVLRVGFSLVRLRLSRTSVPVDVGGATVVADLRTPLGLGLYRYGFCATEARVCRALLRDGDVFVDGGANIGLFALRAASDVGPTGRVIACEPGPGTMQLLRANARRNDHDTVELHEVALSDAPGNASFTIFEDGSGLSSFAPGPSGGRTVGVSVTTLDALTAPFHDRVAVVKLDIEGAEVKALRGAASLIARASPVFLIEVEPEHLARQGSTVDELTRALRSRGYEAYAITPRARLARIDGPWLPPDPSCPNLVLAPASRADRLDGLI